MKASLISLLFSLLAAAPAAAAPALPAFTGFDNAGAALAPAVAEPLAPAPTALARPVVISIVGVDFTEVGFGKLELAYFKAIIAHFRPGGKLDERLFDERLSSVGKDAELAEFYKRQPDNYLDARLAGVLPADRYEIVPVRWSRDPEESAAALPVVEKEIKKIFAAAKAEGRPVYLVAHSWGTVLAHTVLHRLAASSPEVRIEKFITLGSPLVPGHWWMELFMELEINTGQLQAYVAKPRNVGAWMNLWARNDYFSNEIKAADKNVRQDGLTVALEARVKKAAEQDHSLRPEALRDLFFLKSLKTWHFAYIFDFRIFLKTLKEYHEQRIFEPAISQELAY
ncbi:MAG: hypothetical protein A2049_07125 [Elusimicrobia bacterium GWA2_62_23]|nr:MAG: hypothetical protein A2049_07125 [Elusimicrobia bacterium GWA2_62_23]